MASLPVVHDEIALDLVESLRTVVLACAGPPTPYPGGANRGGWKSRTDFLTWPAPVLGELAARFEGVLNAQGRHAGTIGASWAVVNKLGSFHGRHRHGRATSGVFFVTAGDPLVPTIFEVPGQGDLMVAPQIGRLVLFGDLFHYVPTYPGTDPRITIAFDVKI